MCNQNYSHVDDLWLEVGHKRYIMQFVINKIQQRYGSAGNTRGYVIKSFCRATVRWLPCS